MKTCQSNLHSFQPAARRTSSCFLTTAALCCQFSRRRRSFSGAYFGDVYAWREGDHIAAFWSAVELCSRACMHIIFHSAGFVSGAQCFGGGEGCTAGITFPLPRMKQFDSVSGFDTLTFASPASCWRMCVCLRNHIFVPVTLVFPEREQSEEQMRNVLIGIQLCGRICQSISISMQISEIKVDFTGTRPLWCRGHRSNVVN